jgi:hypothetical protein
MEGESIEESDKNLSLILMNKPVVENALFQSVSIYTMKQLENFRERLTLSSQPDINPIGHKVKVLRFNLLTNEDEDRFITEMIPVLSLTSLVCDLHLLSPLLDERLLLSLVHPARSTLRLLDFSLGYKSVGVFPLVNELISLETLSIYGYSRSWNLEVQYALSLPNVRNFSLTTEFEIFDNGILDFLAACRFHINCALYLDVSYGGMSDDIHRLVPIFRAHKFSKIVWIIPPEDLMPLKDEIMRTPSLDLRQWGTPLPELFENIELPASLFVGVDLDDESDLTILLNSLALRTRGTHFTYVHVRLDDVEFNWSYGDRSDHYAAFIGRLLHHAIKLYELGIIIVDETGADVTTLISKSVLKGLGRHDGH